MENRKISCKFYGIQPINIDESIYVDCLNSKKVVVDNKEKEVINLPVWMEEADDISENMYSSFESLDFGSSFILDLKDELKENLLDDKYSISDALNVEKSEVFVVYNSDLKYFNVLLELDFDFDVKLLEELKEEEIELYYYIRSIFVKENKRSEITEWATKLRKNILSKVRSFISERYDLEVEEELVKITNNSCNFTNVVYTKQFQENQEHLKELFLELNNSSERLLNDNDWFEANGDLYLFKNRFHTIFVNNKKHLKRYIPIQFQIQYLWFYGSIYKNIDKNILLRISEDESKDKEESEILLKEVIKMLSNLQTFDKDLKVFIETDKVNVWDKIEKFWNINDGVEHYKKYIEDYKKKIELIRDNEKEKIINEISSLQEKFKDLKDSADKDFLTRTYTRQRFDTDMKKIFQTEKNPDLSLAFIDADKFKNVNDTYGHQVGDVVLKLLSDTIFATLRENNIDGELYRYGGEEFIVTVLGLSKEKVKEFLEKVRKNIENTKVNVDEHSFGFTISIGISSLKENETVESLIERADQKVYLAKENGRNRIEY